MKRIFLFSVGITLCSGLAASLPTASMASSAAKVRMAIEKVYHDEDASIMRGDASTAMSHYARTYTAILPTGRIETYKTMNKELNALLAQDRASQKPIKSHSTVITFKLNGSNEAQVKAENESVRVVEDINTQHNDTIVSRSTTLDTFVKIKGRWLHQKSIFLASQVTVNGQIVSQ